MKTPTLDSLFDDLAKVLSAPGSGAIAKALVAAFPGPALLADDRGGVIAASAAWGSLVGFAPADLMNCCWTCRIHPDDADSTQGVVAEMVGGKALSRFRNRLVARDGSAVSLEWNATEYLNMDGVLVTLAVARVLSEGE